MNTNAKILVGFLIGTALGTLTGLLMAPSTGRTTRKKINKKAKKLVTQLEGFVKKGKVATAVHAKNGRAAATSR